MIEIIIGLMGLFGVLLKNKWVLLLAATAFLFTIFPILSTSLKVVLGFILFLWILNAGKGK